MAVYAKFFAASPDQNLWGTSSPLSDILDPRLTFHCKMTSEYQTFCWTSVVLDLLDMSVGFGKCPASSANSAYSAIGHRMWCNNWRIALPRRQWLLPHQAFFCYDTDFRFVTFTLHRLSCKVGVIPKEGMTTTKIIKDAFLRHMTQLFCTIFFRFACKEYLKNHKSRHTQERPHECNVCHKSFKDKHTLKEHQHRHTGMRPHTCSICTKSFKTRAELKVCHPSILVRLICKRQYI